MSLKKVKTEITYKVPAWCHCNLQGNMFGQPSKEKCRFCVKEKDHYRCALYNDILSSEGVLVNKSNDCKRATAGFKSVVTDVDDTTAPTPNPKDVIKLSLAEYIKVRKQLIGQGYPEAIADKLAQQYILGGQ